MPEGVRVRLDCHRAGGGSLWPHREQGARRNWCPRVCSGSLWGAPIESTQLQEHTASHTPEEVLVGVHVLACTAWSVTRPGRRSCSSVPRSLHIQRIDCVSRRDLLTANSSACQDKPCGGSRFWPKASLCGGWPGHVLLLSSKPAITGFMSTPYTPL